MIIKLKRSGFWVALFLISYGSLAQSFTSSNLPIIVINTNFQTIVDEPKITADMGVIDNGPGQRNNLTDPFNNYSGKIGIEIRGSSSQMFPKKQYGIELRDALGNGISAPLLGMPPEEDWVLFAPYNDKSLMRDVLAYKLARDLGTYAPRTRYCEVVINNQYQGVYVLIEKVKRDNNRVDISKLEATENTGDDLTGGYIIKLDKQTGNDNAGWTSSYPPPGRSGNQSIYFIYDYPDASKITSQQRNYIQQYMANFEGTLYGLSFTDPVQGYTKYIDVASFIDFFIVNEVSKNVDGYRLSTYLHKDKDSEGGKLNMGPVWDFNLGFGNANYCTQGNPEGWVTGFNSVCPQDFWLIPFWWSRLYQDKGYRSQLAARWTELRADQYSTPKILTYIDSVYAVLYAESAYRNFQKWPVLGQYVWPNYYIGSTFQDEVNWLKTWVTNRLAWLDNNMPSVITGMESESQPSTVTVYPNPFEREMQVEYTMQQPGTFTLHLFDPIGKSISVQSRYHQDPGTYHLALPTGHLQAGVYFYTAHPTPYTSVSGKIVKLH